MSSKLKQEFEEEIIKHMDSLYNLAFRMTQNRHNAEDLVQETTLRAYRFFYKFKAGTNFKAWIMTILRNVYINEYRKKSKEPTEVEFEDVENFISLPEITGVQEEIFSETIKASIEKLPEEVRTTLTLFYVEGFSYKEIARIMDVPIGTVMSRLHKARQILKKQLSISARERKQ
ncbi:MAG: sigma-70 family RNA polymerase sigma factor [Omnitrophica bacterium]|nr:sigma-70 family RNA polymerase sigma factor [Candidatus Omnitrophota bacterium]